MQNNREQTKGVTRINITGSPIKRAMDAQRMWDIANGIYHETFAPYLLPGSETDDCTPNEFKAGYDKFLGVDVLLAFTNGMMLTLQEKFLTTTFDTVTVEYHNDPLKKIVGDWFELKAQLYFVGYYSDRNPQAGFRKWILLDWPSVVVRTQKGEIPWEGPRPNRWSPAKADFKFVKFTEIPDSCIVAKKF